MYIIGILGSKLLLPGSKYVLWEYVEGLYSIQHSNQYMFYRGAFRMGKGGDAVPLTKFERGRKTGGRRGIGEKEEKVFKM